MRISVSAKLQHPKNKIKTNNKFSYGKATTYGFTPVIVNSMQELASYSLYYAVSPSIYQEGHRHAKKVEAVGDFVIFDADDFTLEATQFMLNQLQNKGWSYLIIPTQNCSPDSIRMRLFIPVIQGTLTQENYKLVWSAIKKELKLPFDEATKDHTRLYAPTLPDPSRYKKYYDEIISKISSTPAFENGFYYHADRSPVDISSLNLQDEELEIKTKKHNFKSEDVFLPGDIFVTVTDAPKEFEALCPLNKEVEIGEVCHVMHLADVQKVNIKCLWQHEHTDPNNDRYAYIVKSDSGFYHYHCGGNECKVHNRDFKVVTLPDVDKFVDKFSLDRFKGTALSTIAMLRDYFKGHTTMDNDSLFDHINHNALLFLLLFTNKNMNTSNYEAPIIKLNGEIIDHVQVNFTSKNLKDVYLTYRLHWSKLFFKPSIFEFIRKWNDEVEDAEDKISTDLLFGEIYKLAVRGKLLTFSSSVTSTIDIFAPRDKVIAGFDFEGKYYQHISSAFRISSIEKPDVSKEVYDDIIKQFKDHWKGLPEMLISMSFANLITRQHRPKVLLLEAVSGAGKSELIRLFADLRLTNNDALALTEFVATNRAAINPQDVQGRLFLSFDEIDFRTAEEVSRGQGMNILKDKLSGETFTVYPKHINSLTVTTGAILMAGAEARSFYDSVDAQTKARIYVFPHKIETPFTALPLYNKYDMIIIKEVIKHYYANYVHNLIQWVKNPDNKEAVHKWALAFVRFLTKATRQADQAQLIEEELEEEKVLAEDLLDRYRMTTKPKSKVDMLQKLGLASHFSPVYAKGEDSVFSNLFTAGVHPDFISKLKKGEVKGFSKLVVIPDSVIIFLDGQTLKPGRYFIMNESPQVTLNFLENYNSPGERVNKFIVELKNFILRKLQEELEDANKQQ